jgi:calcium-binding protein CML
MMRNQFCFSHTGAILLLEEINGTNLGPHFTIAEEMDWDRNGMVNFKEFLFAFTNWVGIDDNEDEED